MKTPAGILLASLLTVVAPLRADEFPLGTYESDLGFLAGSAARYRHDMEQLPGNEPSLSGLESGLGDCRSDFDRMKERVEELKTKESRVHYLQEMEVEPKLRAIDRIRDAHNDRVEGYNQRAYALQSLISEHNNRPHVFAEDDAAGLAAYNQEAGDLDARAAALQREADDEQQQFEAEVDAAVKACGSAQQDLMDAEKQRDAAYESLQADARAYQEHREALVAVFKAVEEEIEARPASHPSFADSSAPQPVGPVGNIHALDQLRVVTKASGLARLTDKEPARADSSAGFDTESTFGAADLPYVAVPEAAVPLELPPPATRQEEAGPVIRGSGTLAKFEQKQEAEVAELEQLYRERTELRQQGADASPAEWTRVVNGISATQARLNFDVVAQRLSEGTTLLDLTITPKTQRKIPEPPPPKP